MKHFLANLAVMPIIFPKLRRHIRNKIMGKTQSNEIDKKQKTLDDLEKKYKYLELKAKWLNHNDGKIPLPGRFEEYDLIFAIGATCFSTWFLRFFDLRRFSSPFDWTGGMEPINWFSQPDIHRDSRFREKISELCNNFQNSLNPKNFKYVNGWHRLDEPHHNIVNTKTHIRYVHEFPADKDIMQYMPEFIKKTQRRIKNLYNAINQSQRILIVWIAGTGTQRTQLESNVSDNDIKWAIKQMQKIYPDKVFDFVFFEPDGTKDRFEYEKIEVIPGAYRIRSNHFLINNEYNFVHPALIEQDNPHVHVISEMLDNIHLSKDAFALPDKDDDE